MRAFVWLALVGLTAAIDDDACPASADGTAGDALLQSRTRIGLVSELDVDRAWRELESELDFAPDGSGGAVVGSALQASTNPCASCVNWVTKTPDGCHLHPDHKVCVNGAGRTACMVPDSVYRGHVGSCPADATPSPTPSVEDCPKKLFVAGQSDDNSGCRGGYHIQGSLHNGHALYKSQSGQFFIYFEPGRRSWFMGSDFTKSGVVTSAGLAPTCPHLVDSGQWWEYGYIYEKRKFGWKKNPSFTVGEPAQRCSSHKFGIDFCGEWCNSDKWQGCFLHTLHATDHRNTDGVDYTCSCAGCNGCQVEACSANMFGVNYCDDWCNHKSKFPGCGVHVLGGADERNAGNIDYMCDCSGCNHCPCSSADDASCQKRQCEFNCKFVWNSGKVPCVGDYRVPLHERDEFCKKKLQGCMWSCEAHAR